MPLSYAKLLQIFEERGITSYTVKRDNVMGQASFKSIKDGGHIDTRTIESLCAYLHCQPGDILEYYEEEKGDGDP